MKPVQIPLEMDVWGNDPNFCSRQDRGDLYYDGRKSAWKWPVGYSFVEDRGRQKSTAVVFCPGKYFFNFCRRENDGRIYRPVKWTRV